MNNETTIICRKCGAEGTHHCSMPGCPLPLLKDNETQSNTTNRTARDWAWVGLVSNCHRWAVNHMDQWEKFKFDTEHGPIYVTIAMENPYPDSFDRVSIIGQPLDGKTT